MAVGSFRLLVRIRGLAVASVLIGAFSLPALAAALTGRVVDARTGEPIAKAEVSVVGTPIRVHTDENGGFALPDLPEGGAQLQVTCIGYGLIKRIVSTASKNSPPIVIVIYPEAAGRNEVVNVTSRPFDTLDTNAASETTLSKRELQALSMVLLEDPLRAAQALPGVTSNNDFDSRFSVRGAGPNHVGVYIDGVLTSNFMDSTSFSVGGLGGTADLSLPIVNADMVSEMSLQDGAYPSNYGDSTAAVLTMQTRDGDFDKVSGRALLGLLGSSGVIDAPVADHKGSWILAGRTSRASDLSGVIQGIKNGTTKSGPSQENLTFNFNDFQSKEVYNLSDRQQFGISAIYGNFTLDNHVTAGAENPANSLNTLTSDNLLVDAFWRCTLGAGFFSQTKLFGVVSQFTDKNRNGGTLDRAGNTEMGLRSDFNYQFLPSQDLEAGVYVRNLKGHKTSNTFQPTEPAVPSGVLEAFGRSTAEESFYLKNTWKTERFSLTGGGRIEYSDLTGQTVALPQGALSYRAHGRWTFRAGAGSYAQFPRLEEEYGVFGNRSLHAAVANNYNVSVERIVGSRSRILAEVYDREDRNQIFSLNGQRLNSRQIDLLHFSYQNSVRGHARGAELTLQRRSANKLTGWISYGYAETKYTDHNDQLKFVGDYDQRHTVNVFGSYRVKPTFDLSTQWRYGSGMPVPGFFRFSPSGALEIGSERNTARSPVYSRFDLRANKAFSVKRCKLTLSGELLNALNHANVFFLTQDPARIQKGSLFVSQEKQSVPITPAVSLAIEF